MTTSQSFYSCHWCAATSAPREWQLRERMFGDGSTHRYHECTVCGSMQLVEVPDDMSPYYPPHYMAYPTAEAVGWKRLARRLRSRLVASLPLALGRKLNAPWVLQALHGRMPSRATAILDVGCGTGAALSHLADAGYTNLTGLEPYLAADRRLINGVFIRRGTIDAMDGQFSLIMCHHALEHMVDPVAALRHFRRLLRPGGRIWVRVPFAGCAAWEEYRTDWVQLDPPRHLCIPSLAGMTAAVAKAELRIDRVEFDSSAFQFWGSELARKGVPLLNSETKRNVDIRSHFSALELARWEARSRELNLQGKGDQGGFWLVA